MPEILPVTSKIRQRSAALHHASWKYCHARPNIGAQEGERHETPPYATRARYRPAAVSCRPRRRHRLEEGRRRSRQDRLGERRSAPLRAAAIRPAGHAGRCRDQTGIGARRMGRLCAHAGRGHADGRPGIARHGNHARHDQIAGQRAGHHRHPQSHSPRHSRDLLHACRRARRSRENGSVDPGCAFVGKQDALRSAGHHRHCGAGD